MHNRIDQSKSLAVFITFISNALAKQRGLVPIIGTIMVLVGFILLAINVFIEMKLLEFLGIIFQGIGIISALVGLLLAEPLGK